jgi:hypothetical protein
LSSSLFLKKERQMPWSKVSRKECCILFPIIGRIGKRIILTFTQQKRLQKETKIDTITVVYLVKITKQCGRAASY